METILFTFVPAFPGLSNEKKKAGLFYRPQTHKLIQDKNFLLSMTEVEKVSWDAFGKVTQNFQGNKKARNYIQLVNDLLDKLHNFYVVIWTPFQKMLVLPPGY